MESSSSLLLYAYDHLYHAHRSSINDVWVMTVTLGIRQREGACNISAGYSTLSITPAGRNSAVVGRTRVHKLMAEFAPVDFARARKFPEEHHHAVLATRKRDGGVQMSPVTSGLDAHDHVIISSRETAYKVRNLRREPLASVCVFTAAFHGGGWVQINGAGEVISLPQALDGLVYLQRQVYGEHKSRPEFRQRMERERRVIIRIAMASVGPVRRG